MDPALMAEALIGTKVAGRYRLLRLLGEGGFAWVFEAEHHSLGHKVAIKILKPTPPSQDQARLLARFDREAQLSALLSHPDLVQIHDHGRTQHGLPYIAMELLQGRTLTKELWLHGAMEPGRAVRLMKRCLHALDVAHKKGVIHRDIKPENLFLTHPDERTEALKILDFGIAFLFDEEGGRLTASGEFFGTPEYASPEMVERREVVTPAVDVYQMGLVLVEMLTGQRLVALLDPMQCLFAHCNGHVKVPEYLQGSSLGKVLTKALAREPAHRIQNAGEFLHALDQVPQTDLVDLRPQGTTLLTPASAPWPAESFRSWETRITTLWLEEGGRPATLTLPPDPPPESLPPSALHSPQALRWASLLLAAGLGMAALWAWDPAPPPAAQGQQEALPPAAPLAASPVASLKPPPAPSLLLIQTVPSGAYVFDRDVLLGTSPLSMPTPQAPLSLTLRHPGFEDQTIEVPTHATLPATCGPLSRERRPRGAAPQEKETVSKASCPIQAPLSSPCPPRAACCRPRAAPCAAKNRPDPV